MINFTDELFYLTQRAEWFTLVLWLMVTVLVVVIRGTRTLRREVSILDGGYVNP